MFDIGFGEIMLVAVIALVVLGPERLPKAARTLGTLLRRVREGWDSVRAEVEREIEAEELKQKLKEAQDYMRKTGEDVGETVREGADSLRRTAESIEEQLKDGDPPGAEAKGKGSNSKDGDA